MTFFVIIVSIVVAAVLLVGLALGVRKYTNSKAAKNNQDDKKIDKLEWFSIVLLILAGILVGISFLAPVILTSTAITTDFDFTGTGQIGDTIGGLMNPFISLSGVIITGLAFYMQYKANVLQRELFKKEQKASNKQFREQINFQQFESQFYEMLKLHKENVNEMEVSGTGIDNMENRSIGNVNIKGQKNKEIIITKRKVFHQMKVELELLLEIAIKDRNVPLAQHSNQDYVPNLLPLTEKIFQSCYRIFFWGFHSKEPYDIIPSAKSEIEDLFSAAPETLEKFPLIQNRGLIIDRFRGHSSLLGHYYRHLFLMVKFVVESEIVIEEKDKKRYLKIIRAQLSNYEQIMMFYNWLGGYGAAWENVDNHFFTQYDMIHNLWYDDLFDNEYIRNAIKELKKIHQQLKPGNNMFEIDD